MSNALRALLAGDQLERLLVEAVHRLERAAACRPRGGACRNAAIRLRRSLSRSSVSWFGEAEVLHLELVGVGIALGLERIVLRAQVVAAEIAGPQADAHRVGHRHVGRHARLPRAERPCVAIEPMNGILAGVVQRR